MESFKVCQLLEDFYKDDESINKNVATSLSRYVSVVSGEENEREEDSKDSDG